MNQPKFSRLVLCLIIVAQLISCVAKNKESKGQALYNSYCASCHVLPSIEDLPKAIWENGVLPDMAARMGIIDSSNNPLNRKSFLEQEAILKSGIYPNTPIISTEDWDILRSYILQKAPDSLITNSNSPQSKLITQFDMKAVNIDSTKGSYATFLEFNKSDNTAMIGNVGGSIFSYNGASNKVKKIDQRYSAPTSITKKKNKTYVTTVGFLDPSELSQGEITIIDSSNVTKLPMYFHRPVYTSVEDLNNNGQEELIISEFGDLTGSLSLVIPNKNQIGFKKKILLKQPGATRTITRDMNNDGKLDIVALFAQGREGVSIFYQKDNLNFKFETVISLNPVFGSSWFDLLDYDNDGDQDIVIANGDNADKSFVPKPYHGLRIYINDGENRFEEKYFYPLNGATRFVANDFDQDGDFDFGVLSTFPDYTKAPNKTFVYLENVSSESFEFKTFTIDQNKLGRWFLMDDGDVDNDGDVDIIISSFTYTFTPVPKKYEELWKESECDILILENKLITKE
jgi:hypothetical protein